MASANKLAVAGVGLLASLVAQKAAQAVWGFLTGEEPPNPNDPDVPAPVAFSWAIASGVGLLVAQVFSNRFAARRYSKRVNKAIKIEF